MRNSPPSFKSLNSDCNPCFSFAGIFQWRICQSTDLFHSYASCHISGLVPCLVLAFFSLFIFCKQLSSLFICGVDAYMLHFSFFIGMKSLSFWTLGQCLWNILQDLSIAKLQNYMVFHEGPPHIPDSQEEPFDLRPRKHWVHLFSFLRLRLENVYFTDNSPNPFFTDLFPLA